MALHVKGTSPGFEQTGKALPSNQLEIFWQKYCEKTNFLGGNAMVWSILAYWPFVEKY